MLDKKRLVYTKLTGDFNAGFDSTNTPIAIARSYCSVTSTSLDYGYADFNIDSENDWQPIKWIGKGTNECLDWSVLEASDGSRGWIPNSQIKFPPHKPVLRAICHLNYPTELVLISECISRYDGGIEKAKLKKVGVVGTVQTIDTIQSGNEVAYTWNARSKLNSFWMLQSLGGIDDYVSSSLLATELALIDIVETNPFQYDGSMLRVYDYPGDDGDFEGWSEGISFTITDRQKVEKLFDEGAIVLPPGFSTLSEYIPPYRDDVISKPPTPPIIYTATSVSNTLDGTFTTHSLSDVNYLREPKTVYLINGIVEPRSWCSSTSEPVSWTLGYSGALKVASKLMVGEGLNNCEGWSVLEDPKYGRGWVNNAELILPPLRPHIYAYCHQNYAGESVTSVECQKRMESGVSRSKLIKYGAVMGRIVDSKYQTHSYTLDYGDPVEGSFTGSLIQKDFGYHWVNLWDPEGGDMEGWSNHLTFELVP
ncbi:MAG: hypothetical protein ACJ0KD_01785 [Dehalococcoidia bacterium]